MNLETGVNLGQLLIAFGGVLVASGVAWGSLLQRVRVVEKEIEKLSGFEGRLIRIESEVGHIKSGIDELRNGVSQLTGSWLMQEPPSYVSTNPSRPRRRSS